METYLVDTNIILRFADKNAAEHREVTRVLQILLEREVSVYLVPQVAYEFWAVATRPVSANGLGWNIESVEHKVKMLTSDYALLPEVADVYRNWLELVVKYEVKGKQVHDARLVAAMQAHLLTLNTEDFKRFTEIAPVHPGEVVTEEGESRT
jgi:predicted nucleic acid-binding protein